MSKKFLISGATMLFLMVGIMGFIFLNRSSELGLEDKNLFLEAQTLMSKITIPYYYFDGAYDYGVKNCDNPGCVELSPGLQQGDYDKNNDSFLRIYGELHDGLEHPYIRTQISLTCVSLLMPSRSCALNSNAVTVGGTPNPATAYSLVLDQPSTEITLDIITSNKDLIVARNKFIRDVGGDEYRVDRKKRKLTIVYYEEVYDKEQLIKKVVYPKNDPVATLLEYPSAQ